MDKPIFLSTDVRSSATGGVRRLAGLALAGLMLAAPLAYTPVNAQPAATDEARPAPGERRAGQPGKHGEPRGWHAHRGEHPHADRGPRGKGPAMGKHRAQGPFAGLTLTEAQRDQLFKIRHDNAPAMREHRKAMRKAQQAFRELARAERFDDARAKELAATAAQAQAAWQVLMAQNHHQMQAVLTPEQRQQLSERRSRARGHDHAHQRG